VSLGEIVRFGVKQVLNDAKGADAAYAAISDEDIESILKRGTILSDSTADAKPAVPSQNVEELPGGDEFEKTLREGEAQSLWLFDGHDYSADHVKADSDALAALGDDDDDADGLLSPKRSKGPASAKKSSVKKTKTILDDEGDDDDDGDERTARRLARKRTFMDKSPLSKPMKRIKLNDDGEEISVEDSDDYEDLETTARRPPTRNRPVAPPGYVSMSISISDDEIDALTKEGVNRAMLAAAQRAAAQGSPIIDDEAGGSDTGLSGDVTDENSTCINLVTGDVTKPMGPDDRSKLVITYAAPMSLFFAHFLSRLFNRAERWMTVAVGAGAVCLTPSADFARLPRCNILLQDRLESLKWVACTSSPVPRMMMVWNSTKRPQKCSSDCSSVSTATRAMATLDQST
jgi:hypothetical protein